MSEKSPIAGRFVRLRWGAVAAYAACVSAFLLITWSATSDIFTRRAAVAAADDLLARLEGRRPDATKTTGSATDAPTGSAFLEGPTMTVAGAAILQRVASAVTRFGGNVVSTQVDLQGTQSKAGYISVTAGCDIEQPALQKVLYDLEAGMPFLFIDQLLVQAPTASSGPQAGRLRVVLTVSGQWQGEK